MQLIPVALEGNAVTIAHLLKDAEEFIDWVGGRGAINLDHCGVVSQIGLELGTFLGKDFFGDRALLLAHEECHVVAAGSCLHLLSTIRDHYLCSAALEVESLSENIVKLVPRRAGGQYVRALDEDDLVSLAVEPDKVVGAVRRVRVIAECADAHFTCLHNIVHKVLGIVLIQRANRTLLINAH
jgi:hypothetical protein